jgi:hypothetical protein
MMINEIQNAKDELMREAHKAANQICKIKSAEGPFVKARRGYSYPDGVRMIYLKAFEALVREGKLKSILRNKDFDLYEVVDSNGHVISVAQAKELLIEKAHQEGQIFKIHSRDGEFVQTGDKAYCDMEEERIVFLEALSQLMRHRQLSLVSDSAEVCRYEISKPMYADVDQESPKHAGPTAFAA